MNQEELEGHKTHLQRMLGVKEDHVDKHRDEFKIDPEVPVLFVFKINDTGIKNHRQGDGIKEIEEFLVF